jgi:hypothetical protein
VIDKFYKWIYQIFGQAEEPQLSFFKVFWTYGFITKTEWIFQAKSRVMLIIAQKK